MVVKRLGLCWVRLRLLKGRMPTGRPEGACFVLLTQRVETGRLMALPIARSARIQIVLLVILEAGTEFTCNSKITYAYQIFITTAVNRLFPLAARSAPELVGSLCFESCSPCDLLSNLASSHF